MKYNLIVACSDNRGIGMGGNIPWRLPEDLKQFAKLTTSRGSHRSVVIMGRKTWDSIPDIYRPLKDRINVVITGMNITNDNPNVVFLPSTIAADDYIKENYPHSSIWIIGGEMVYRDYLTRGLVQKIFLTRVSGNFDVDTYFPHINSGPTYFQLDTISPKYTSCNKQNTEYQYFTYKPYISHRDTAQKGEYQYQALLDDIIKEGIDRPDRTGVGTRSRFGCQMRYSLDGSFPLLTTKKMFLRGIVEELLWFLRGETNAITLRDKKVRIWEGNSSREYLDSIGLTHYEEGDCGPIYGFNFRHFGATYYNCKTSYEGKGYDQFNECVRLIKEEPFSRRILINLWNPCDLDKVALPPCHVLYQFYVEPSEEPDKGNWLSCSFYQRSGDVGLGIPFNIASASLLTYILAHLTGTRPRELIHNIGDAHIYKNHIESLKPQINRSPYPFPKMSIKNRGQTRPSDFQWGDFNLEGYQHHPSIKMSMAV